MLVWASVPALAPLVLVGIYITSSNTDTLPKINDADARVAEVPSQSAGQELLAAAEEGNVEAQYRLGRSKLMEAAIDAAKGTEAVSWLKRAADGGHSGAMTRLGLMYQRGTGVLQNYDLAVYWIARAAQKGDPNSMLEYGRLYRDGIGLDKDLIQAYIWLNRSAAANNMTAMREREAVALLLSKDELRLAQNLSMAPLREGRKDAGQTEAQPLDENSYGTNGLQNIAAAAVALKRIEQAN